MTGEQTLLARGAIGVAGTLASVLLVSISGLRTVSRETFNRMVTGLLVASRFGLFAALFLVLHLELRGDIPTFYWNESRAVLRGGLPYRDFTSSYAPLHPYLDAAVIRAWSTPLSIVLLAIVCECLMLPIWLSLGRRLFPEQELRTAALLYLASPLSLVFVAVDGQDNVIIALLLALSLLLLERSRAVLSGLCTGLAIAAVKFLPLLFTPAFFFASTRRWRWTAGVVAVVAVVYGAAVAKHLPIAQPLTVEGNLRTSGNVPYIFETLTGRIVSAHVWDGLTLLALGAVVLFIARTVRNQSHQSRLLAITFAMPAIMLTLVTLSKKGWPNYLMLMLFPLCLLARRMNRLQITVFGLFAAVCLVEHSYWATMLHQCGSADAHALLVRHPTTQAVRMLIGGHILFEILLVAGYCWLLLLSLRAIASTRSLPEEQPAVVDMRARKAASGTIPVAERG